MNNALFITGTDTGVGKTIITSFLGRLFTARGVKTITQKWIQTGCVGISEDIASHMKLIPNGEKYIEKYHADMAPYVLEFPSSPHLAALLEKKHIDAGRIEKSFCRLTEEFDFILVEGTGGPLVPISEERTIIDVAEKLCLSVLVVAENRLGAINQTLLAVEALKKRGLKIEGIVFNRLLEESNELILKDNMQIIGKLTGEEVLGELHYNKNTDMLYEEFLPIGERIFEKMQNEK